MCRRDLSLHFRTQNLQRRGVIRIYHFPEPRKKSTMLPKKHTSWILHTEIISGAGLITNATKCSISTNEIYTFPELHESSDTNLDTPQMYISAKVSVVADYEMKILGEITPMEVERLNNIKSQVMASPKIYAIASLLHAYYIFSRQEQRFYWHQILNTTLCTATIFGILCLSLRSYLRRISRCCSSLRTVPKPNTETQSLPSTTSEPKENAVKSENDDSE
jgi:hypothetical protein